jgi:pyruvate carboxylase
VLQSPRLAGAIRTYDLCEVVTNLARYVRELSAVDVISQETMFDCLVRARECPFRRIEEMRRAAPGLVLRASLSAATCLGASSAPRGVLTITAAELVRSGIDIIRICDPFNDLDRIVAAVTAASLSDAVVEGAVCLDGALHPNLPGAVSAAVAVAAGLERHGAHVLVIEDRIGALRPVSAYALVRAIRREVSLPLCVRIVESSGYGLASLLSAIEAGAVGADTALPTVAGPGHELDGVVLTNAIHDTERRPETGLPGLVMMDEHIRALCSQLGGWRGFDRPPPDAPDRGITPAFLAEVTDRTIDSRTVSQDQALAACEAAWRALGQPAWVSPARQSLVELAVRMIESGEAGGILLDRARVDDPQGLLDSVGSLRDGGFPESPTAEVDPRSRKELLEVLWGDRAKELRRHQEQFGDLEMIPARACFLGIGPGDEFQLVVDGEVRRIQVLAVDAESGEATVEIDGEQVQIPALSGSP